MWNKLKISWRLTLANTLVILVIYSILAIALHGFLWNLLDNDARNQLETRIKTVVDVLQNSGGDLYDLYHLGQELPYSVWDGDRLVYQTEGWQHYGVSFPKSGPPSGRQIIERKDEILQLGSQAVEDYPYTVQALHPYGPTLRMRRQIKLTLLLITPLIALLALLGGYFQARQALRPIKSLTRQAGSIAADTLSKRLSVRNEKDEIGELTQVFNEFLERLESAFENLKRFTSDAAHELRSPLTSIRSVGEVALQGPEEVDSYRSALGSILEETERLAQLSESLLTLTRAEGAPEDIKREPTDLPDLLRQCVADLQVLAEEKNIELIYSGVEKQDLNVNVELLRRAFLNIISNSLRYTGETGKISVGCRSDRSDLMIEVCDTGVGIPHDQRQAVFERFYRLDTSRTRATGGFGLGLAIALQAVRFHGGSITFEDREGWSLCCAIRLPLE